MCNKKLMEYILCKEYLAKKRSFIKKNAKKLEQDCYLFLFRDIL